MFDIFSDTQWVVVGEATRRSVHRSIALLLLGITPCLDRIAGDLGERVQVHAQFPTQSNYLTNDPFGIGERFGGLGCLGCDLSLGGTLVAHVLFGIVMSVMVMSVVVRSGG